MARVFVRFFFALIAALLLSLPAIVQAQQIAIGAYPVPTVNSAPNSITTGSDDALWFAEIFGNQIGRITIAGAFTEYAVPTSNSDPIGITAGPDGALWFTEYFGNQIGRITTAGIITEYPIPTANSYPYGITTGPDGALWFTEVEANQIGRITTAGLISEYPTPTSPSAPNGITTGPDGALWFTESYYYANKIGRITTAGAITEYPLPTGYDDPVGITTGPDGALWFTNVTPHNGGYIGRITTTGIINEYLVPTANNGPVGITTGPDGALWFTEWNTNKIGRITTTGAITEYPLPVCTFAKPNYVGCSPEGITMGPDGALWFTEYDGNQIGQAVFVTSILGVSPASGTYRTNLTFAGSGFGANENVQIYSSGVGSAVLASATADSTGSFTTMARAQQSPYGPRLFLGVGQASGKLGAANFSVTPRLILTPNSGATGSTVTAQGFGFGSLENVKIYWKDPNVPLGTVTTNVNGTFNGTAAFIFQVPTAPPGGNTVIAICCTGTIRATASFTVE